MNVRFTKEMAALPEKPWLVPVFEDKTGGQAPKDLPPEKNPP